MIIISYLYNEIACNKLMLDRNTWNHIIMYKPNIINQELLL